MLRDWPDEEILSASVASNATSITVADGTQYYANEYLELDTELVRISSISTNTLNIDRARRGTVAASHVANTTILRNPNFYAVEILDALNDGLDEAWPYIWRQVVDESGISITDASVYEYTIPTDPNTGQQYPLVYGIWVKIPGDLTFRPLRRWSLVRGGYTGTDKLHFKFQPTPGSVTRIYAATRFPRLVNLTDNLDAQWPQNMEYPLAEYAAASMLASGEAARVRVDRGVMDSREQANQVGASMQASNLFLTRYRMRIANCGYPPLPRHEVAI